jgi:hypothetical protein
MSIMSNQLLDSGGFQQFTILAEFNSYKSSNLFHIYLKLEKQRETKLEE